MSVYVDPIALCCSTGTNWRWPKSCHMIADSEAELHAMADRLRLNRSWFQDHAVMPHYDLTEGKRHQAIRFGAVALSFGEMRLRMREARHHDGPTGWNVGYTRRELASELCKRMGWPIGDGLPCIEFRTLSKDQMADLLTALEPAR